MLVGAGVGDGTGTGVTVGGKVAVADAVGIGVPAGVDVTAAIKIVVGVRIGAGSDLHATDIDKAANENINRRFFCICYYFIRDTLKSSLYLG